MCGIVGYVGVERHDLGGTLLAALATLEYRGYDSAGLAFLHAGRIKVVKATGGLANLVRKAQALPSSAAVGFAHTRWATHGAATEANAHPHLAPDGRFSLVLNGIVENDADLRQQLADRGVTLATDNDGETLLRWIEAHNPAANLEKALEEALSQVVGNFAVVVAHSNHPATLGVARRGSPLAIAPTEGGYFVISDAAAVRAAIEQIYYLKDGEILVLTPGRRTDIAFQAVPTAVATPTQEGFESFTLKEIHEQPRMLASALSSALAQSLPSRGLDAGLLRSIDRVVLVGCGSAYFASCTAKALIKRHARLPTEAVIASEFRLSDQPTVFWDRV